MQIRPGLTIFNLYVDLYLVDPFSITTEKNFISQIFVFIRTLVKYMIDFASSRGKKSKQHRNSESDYHLGRRRRRSHIAIGQDRGVGLGISTVLSAKFLQNSNRLLSMAAHA